MFFCLQTAHVSIIVSELFPYWQFDKVRQDHLLPLSLVCEPLGLSCCVSHQATAGPGLLAEFQSAGCYGYVWGMRALGC